MALTTNLVSYYKFDGGATDSSASNDLTVDGATNNASYGKINQGYDFDGTNDKLYRNNLMGGDTNFTVSLWWYENTLANSDGLISECPIGSGGTTAGWSIWSYNGDVTLSNSNGTTVQQNDIATGVSATTWHHLVMVKSGTTVTAYLDGTAQTAVTSLDFGTSTQVLNIGLSNRFNNSEWTYSDMWFDGYMDEVGLWDRALTSTEVGELYNSGSGKQYPFTVISSNFFQLF